MVRRSKKEETPSDDSMEEEEEEEEEEDEYEEEEEEEEGSDHDGSEEGDHIHLSDPPTEINPYEVLGVPQTASDSEIRTAYRKLALITHPDKAKPEDKDEAHVKFQKIAFAYAVLGDENRRQRYDRTGRTDEGLGEDDDFDWKSFYNEMYEDVVTGETLEQFKQSYQGTEEEREDLLESYNQHEGSLDGIFESVMLSDPTVDEPRFRKIIDEAIEAGDVPSYPAYQAEDAKSRKRRVQTAKKEQKEAEALAKKMGVYDKLFGNKSKNGEEDGDDDGGEGSSSKKGKKKKGKKESNPEDDPDHPLAKLIRERQKQRGVGGASFFDNLEAKYVGGGGKRNGGKRAAAASPTEAEFQTARSKVNKKSKK